MKLVIMDTLRKQGYKIEVEHHRWTQYGLYPMRQIREEQAGIPVDNPMLKNRKVYVKHEIQPLGGKVRVKITCPTGGSATAESNCSRLDNFNARIGTTMALGRAMKMLGIKRKTKQK